MSDASSQPGEQVQLPADVQPSGERIHVPGESALPLVMGIGITLAVIGLTTWWLWSAIGLALVAISGFLWIRDARREFLALPDDEDSR